MHVVAAVIYRGLDRLGFVAGSGPSVTVVRRGPRLSKEAWTGLVREFPLSERLRLEGLHRWEDRQDSALGWDMLHRVAAGQQVTVHRDETGRPCAGAPLDVSLSHSDGWIAVAASRTGRVGIDVEAHRPVPHSLARRCLTATELEWLDRSPSGTWNDRFLRVWTAKEAYLKALGVGLARDPRTVELDLRNGDPVLCGGEQERWTFATSNPATGVLVTVCAERAC